MRRRTLLLTVLLAGIFLANFAAAAENDPLLQVTSPAPQMTLADATADPACNAPSDQLSALESVIFMGDLDDICGPCGAPYCRSAQVYSPCGNDNRQCIPSGFCSAGVPRCYCLSNP